jgi:hypothetical protein
VRTALSRVGAQLSEEERAQVGSAMREVEAAVVSGEAQRLKRANAALDESTQRLATLLVEQALAAAQKS